MDNNIGKKLKELRLGKDLSQEELSKILGTKRATLGNWEIGRAEPDTEMINKIATFFGVSVNYLIGKETSFVEENVYRIIGSSGDLTDEEWNKIFENFETIVAGIKAKREK